MICSYTQTYGNNRAEIIDFKNNDYLDIGFRKKFDLNLYCFHNSSPEYIDSLTDNEYFKQIKFEYNLISGMPYTQSLHKNLILLKKKGCTKVFFAQDDVFSGQGVLSEKDYDELFSIIKEEKFNMINLEFNSRDDFKNANMEPVFTCGSVQVFNTTTHDFVNYGHWSFDDSAYVADIDFVLDTIYDENYYSIGSVWTAEHQLNEKFKAMDVERKISNKKFFYRSNIIGANDWNRKTELEKLQNTFKK